MIVENKYLDEIRKIWKENNSGYISKKSNDTALSHEKMIPIVYLEDGEAAGYVIVYQGNDFCKLEDFPDQIQNTSDKIAYVWEIAVKKQFAGKGIGKKLIQYVIEKFQGYTLYSCININNLPSLNLHKKYGFSELYYFDEEDKGKKVKHTMMERKDKG